MNRDDIHKILGPDGLLSQMIDDYEFRPQQKEMAEAVFDAINENHHLVVEAATGTGKSIAYLIPSLISQKQVVIATHTKALQEQLFYKDIPMLKKYWKVPFTASLLKGRNNYLCRYKYEAFVGDVVELDQLKAFRKLTQWADKTNTGDQSELPKEVLDSRIWSSVSMDSAGCLGTKCPAYEECFVTKSRKEALDSNLIVVNHHLFFSDLMLKEKRQQFLSYSAVVLDEAHHIEKIATEALGHEFSTSRSNQIAIDLQVLLSQLQAKDDRITRALKQLENITKKYFSVISFGLTERSSVDLVEHLTNKNNFVLESIRPHHKELCDAFDELISSIRASDVLGDQKDLQLNKITSYYKDYLFIYDHEEVSYVFYIEHSQYYTRLKAAPLDVSSDLSYRLTNAGNPVIFTSATLATNHTLKYFSYGVGLSDNDGHKELILPEVFDYTKQCALYIPVNLPEPDNKVDNSKEVAQIVQYLIKTTEGRAFVLFTSYKKLNAVYDLLEDQIPYTVLKQGDASTDELIKKFKEDVHSVLFGTSSFWEGVDIKGEALSLVIIEKIPFPNYSDPIVRGRQKYKESQGRNSFREYMIPEASLMLKQGFGRLIRSKTDSGIIAILDSRLHTRSYRHEILNSLPKGMEFCIKAIQARYWWDKKMGKIKE